MTPKFSLPADTIARMKMLHKQEERTDAPAKPRREFSDSADDGKAKATAR